MIAQLETEILPRTLEEFKQWEPNDGFKYEWNDGELIKFTGMGKKQIYIFDLLNRLFAKKGYLETGSLIAETDVQLSGIQMRRPDIAYFTKVQVKAGRYGEDVIPEFAIEVISGNDLIYKVDKKLTEYFKSGVVIVWLIMPESESVHVYTSRQNVKICFGDDICSAAPVLPDFEISVADIFKED